ncbi:MAG: ROK family glucokinase [Lachnospiraceae bacterium]|nr:ROK family glucokinase [Candidatus Merdinaster equi]
MMQYVFGVDLGGTTVKLGLFTTEGELVDKWEIPTRKDFDGKYILPDIADSVLAKMDEKQITKADVAGLGIGAPGPVNEEGTIFGAANLGWGTLNINEALSSLTGLNVKAGNDANVAALGEMWKGGGQGYKNLVAVTLGTGVGGGIIVEGNLLAGATGAGGEIGHIHVEDNETEVCGCGNRGCLEQYTSATGIVRLAKRMLASTDEPSVLRSTEISAKTVFDAVKDGDVLANKIAEQFGEYLGKGLASVACVVNPEIFVIGGGVSKAGTVLFDYIEDNYKEYVFRGCREAKFALATLGNDAGIYGAAKLAL